MSSSPLLVPVHLDAFVYRKGSATGSFGLFHADYGNLARYEDILAAPFSEVEPPEKEGVYLHWALPDGLTKGDASGKGPIAFPAVPNRWLIGRFGNVSDEWQGRFWVLESDYLGDDGSNPYLDPAQPSTPRRVFEKRIGKAYRIEDWKADGGGHSVRAVAPGNLYFSASIAFNENVFSFVDTDVPLSGGDGGKYSYLVLGWYAEPLKDDPLRGVSAYVSDGAWPDEPAWRQATPAERFQVTCRRLRWSTAAHVPERAPDRTLCHGMVYGVDPSHRGPGHEKLDLDKVRVVVANTAIDALAELIERQSGETPTAKRAGKTLSKLLRAAQYDVLETLDAPGGEARLEEKIHENWYGSTPGGYRWQLSGTAPQAAGDDPSLDELSAEQKVYLEGRLAALNKRQRIQNESLRDLHGLQRELYHLWIKNERAFRTSTEQGITSYALDETLHPSNVTPSIDVVRKLLAHELNFAPDAKPEFSLVDRNGASVTPDPLVRTVWQALHRVHKRAAMLPPVDATQSEIDRFAAGYFKAIPPGRGAAGPTLSSLRLQLRRSAEPRFYHPNDPVVLISGIGRTRRHGEDGRYNKDRTLTCRTLDQTIAGLDPAVSIDGIDITFGEALKPITAVSAADLGRVLSEAFWIDPTSPKPIDASERTRLEQWLARWREAIVSGQREHRAAARPDDTPFVGVLPAPFSMARWKQPWNPLFLEWETMFYPSGRGSQYQRRFSAGDWRFDGTRFEWLGQGYAKDAALAFAGRTALTPHVGQLFKDRIDKYLADHPALDRAAIDGLLASVSGWDLLSQSLSGFGDRLVTQTRFGAFPPPAGPVSHGALPDPAHERSPTPSVATLVGEQYHTVPVADQRERYINEFQPVRAGFLRLSKLRVIDTFGQKVDLLESDTGITPLGGDGFDIPVATDASTSPVPAGFELPPRLVQPSRLELRFLANDGTGEDVLVGGNPNPVCGWLVPNHIDGGLSVYAADGKALGELLPPELATDEEAQFVASIANETLRRVVGSFAAHKAGGGFERLLRAIDETLWLVDPLGGRKDPMESVLMGRPLAVVQAQLHLTLDGPACTNQQFAAMLATPEVKEKPVDDHSRFYRRHDTGGVETLEFPLRLGRPEFRDDGLIGYFLNTELDAGTDRYPSLYTVHLPQETPAEGFLKPIFDKQRGSNLLSLPVGDTRRDPAVSVTMLLDPRGGVHASGGLLPLTVARLPPDQIESALKAIELRFRAGPLLSPADRLAIPAPSDKRGRWSWEPESLPLVDAGKLPLFPDEPPVMHEGWLSRRRATDKK